MLESNVILNFCKSDDQVTNEETPYLEVISMNHLTNSILSSNQGQYKKVLKYVSIIRTNPLVC
jgi:hypothetical protein